MTSCGCKMILGGRRKETLFEFNTSLNRLSG
jgi:hypothetical protein